MCVFSITFTTTKTLNFSHGDFVSVGSFIGVTILWLLLGKPINSPFVGVTLPIWQQLLAAVVTVLLIGLIGVALYFLAVRPFAGKPGMSWVMSTIGFGIILTSIGLAVWGPAQIVVPSPVGDEIVRIAGVGIRPQEILMFVVAIVVMAALDWVMHRTMMGKAMRAVAHDRRVASLMGINVTTVMVGAFFLSSALAGLSGFLITPIASASLYVGLSIALKGFSGAIIGGLSNPRGCVLGGFALGVLESLVNLWQAQWREIVVFLLVILLLVLFGGAGSLYGPLIGAISLTLIDALLARWPPVQHFAYGGLLLFALYAMPNGVAGVFSRFFARKPGIKPAAANAPIPKMSSDRHQEGSAPLLEVVSVSKNFGGFRPANDVTFRLQRGHVHARIGPNGAGKSTLLRAIVGLEPAKEGRVFLDGVDITMTPAHRRTGLGVALSPEGRGIFADQSVRDDLLLGAYSKREPSVTVQKIEKYFGLFPRLRERDDQFAGTLSGGEQQMLAIARALMSEPKLLLLDEPSLGLAPLIIRDIFKIIRSLREQGLTILLVEQMANQALAVADHAYVLETGGITLQGKGCELLNDPKIHAAYLGAH